MLPSGGARAHTQQQQQGRLTWPNGSGSLQQEQQQRPAIMQPPGTTAAQSVTSSNIDVSKLQQDDDDVLIEFKDVWKSFGNKHILRVRA